MVTSTILFLIVLFFVLLLLFYRFIFLRDPERKIPSGRNIVSPADGKIIKIVEIKNIDLIKIRKGLLGKIKALVEDICNDGYLITIMMNVFDVHIQRAPIGGVVTRTKHSPGKFKNAVYGDKFENGIENEKNEIIIASKELGKIKIIQIAGFLARRIECFVKENQKINKGEKIGRIIIGSQVSLILPKKVELLVKKGDKVKAGESVIAEY